MTKMYSFLAWALCSSLAALWLGGCGDSVDVLDASTVDASPQVGAIALKWSIVDGAITRRCSEVGAVLVSLSLVKQGEASGVAESFNCRSGQGSSRGYPVGRYDIVIDVQAGGSRSLLDSPVRVFDFDISADGVSDLPAQQFSIAAIGSFDFTVDGGAIAGNCESNSTGGAGIVGLSMVLKNTNGQCVPSEFSIAGGSGSAGSYIVDCATPRPFFGCIGSEQKITVVGTESGPLTLEIVGQKPGPIDCYSRVSKFDLAGANLSTALGVLPLSLEYSPECDPNYSYPDAGVVDAAP